MNERCPSAIITRKLKKKHTRHSSGAYDKEGVGDREKVGES